MDTKTIMSILNKIWILIIGLTRPTISMLLVYIAYLLFGSMCFVMIETGEEERAREESREVYAESLEIIKILREANYTDGDIYAAATKEKALLKGSTSSSLGWGQMFGDKLFFAFILITTVGYGNVAPKSLWGQVICVIYTLLGLPIHVIMMRLLSFKFRGGMRMILKACQDYLPDYKIFLILFGSLYMLFFLAIFVFAPSYIFMTSEEWDYTRGIYFSFVSLTTIGLGDYVAGVSSSHQSDYLYTFHVLAMLIWMFFGLGFVAMIINMISYVMGVFTLDKLDCKCRRRTAAREKLKPLLDLTKELNWQLVKAKPDDFEDWAEIEEFRNILADNPQEVDSQMLHRMFEIALDLKEKCYEHLSKVDPITIPMSPIIEQARDNLPSILSMDSVKVSYSKDPMPPKEEQPSADKNTTVVIGTAPSAHVGSSSKRETQDNPDNQGSHNQFIHRGSFSSSKSISPPISDMPAKDIVEDKQNLEENKGTGGSVEDSGPDEAVKLSEDEKKDVEKKDDEKKDDEKKDET